ncbi:MAG: hypothetical protein ABFS41_04280, partial [Myxococcota bacterium]
KITILLPAHGGYTPLGIVVVSGNFSGPPVSNAVVRVNGALATVNPDRTWSVTLPVDTGRIMNPYEATLENVSAGVIVARHRILLHHGQWRVDGTLSEQSVALRLSDPGLDQVEPLIESGVTLDLPTLLPPGSVVIEDYCAIRDPLFGFCIGWITARVDGNPPPSISGFTIDVDAQTDYAFGDVEVYDLSIDLDLDGSGVAPNCGWHFEAAVTPILGDYALQRDAVDNSAVDVNLISAPGVMFQGFADEPTWGICDFFLIGDLIQLIVGDLEPTMQSAFVSFLSDPDGAGPADAPVADAIETALADISITGPLSGSLGVQFEAPLFEVPGLWDGVGEDPEGITLGSDTRVTSSVGTDPGQCIPPVGAPNLLASYHVDEAFPSFGPLTPGGLPYHLALAISTSAFNQLLKAQTECGLLLASITEFPLGPSTVPLTAGILALYLPQFSALPATTKMRIDLRPTLAPLISGNAGPGGEIAEIQVPHLVAEVRELVSNHYWLGLALDFSAGLAIQFDPASNALAFSVQSIDSANLEIAVVQNLLLIPEATIQTALPPLIEPVLPTLGEGLGAFPLPTFLGLELQSVEIARTGSFLTLYANLAAAP